MGSPPSKKAKRMTISVGDKIPACNVHSGFGNPDICISERIAGKKVVLSGLPGAFTPTWSGQNVPGYLANQDKFKAKGFDEIIVFCINDGAVMNAWADAQSVGRDGEGSMVNFIADTGGALTDALGMRMDHDGPMGKFKQDRCKRFSAVVEDGVVTLLHIAEAPDDPAGDDNPHVSLAEQVL